MKRFLLHAILAGHLTLWGGAAADFATTRIGIAQGAREANLPQNAAAQAGIVFGSVAAVEIASHFAGRQFPNMATGFRHTIGGVHIGAALWNAHIIKKQKALSVER